MFHVNWTNKKLISYNPIDDGGWGVGGQKALFKIGQRFSEFDLKYLFLRTTPFLTSTFDFRHSINYSLFYLFNLSKVGSHFKVV